MTRNTTSYREKGRAVVLAALMVLSVVAMGAAFAAPAAADHAEDEKNIGPDGGSIVQGQTAIVDVSNLSPSGDTVELYEDLDDGESHQFTVDVNSTANTATFQTETLDSGSYYLSDGDSTTDNIPIEVRTLSLTDGADGGTMFLQSTIDQEGTAQLQLDSNQGDFVAEISAEDFSQSQLDSMIDGAYAPDGHSNYVVVDNADTTVNVDFSQVSASPGEYNFTVAGAGTTAEETTSIQVTEPGETVIAFGESVAEGVEGDHTTVTVNMQEADTAQLNLTWSPNDEALTVLSGTVTADGDQVEIPINTHALFKGQHGNIVNDDNVVNGSFQVNEAMDASDSDSSAEEVWDRTSTLNMELADANGDRMDRGTFRVTDRATDGMSTYKVSQSVVDNVDASNLNPVMENGAPADGAVAEGDYLAVVIEGDGFYGYADSLTELENNGAYLNVTHQNVPWGGEADELTNDGFHANEDNGTMVAFYEIPSDYADNQYEVSFDVYNKESATNGEAANYNHYTEKTESFSSTFSVELPSFALDSDMYNLAPESGQDISGTTNVAPGAEVDVVTQTPDASDHPFYESATAEVGTDGTWTATLDLTGEVQETEFGIDAELLDYTANGESLTDSADGIIGEGTGAEGSLSISTDAPSEVTVGDDASLTVTIENRGDTAASGTVSITVDGEEVTSEELELESDGTQEFTHDFDTSSTGDISYSVTTTDDDDEEDDSASGTVTVEEESPDDEEPGEGDENDDDDDGQPGFGVAVALVALLSAAMLALRRQN